MWMFVEGLQLYRISFNVLDVWTTKWNIYFVLLAYTLPLIIVGVTILTASSLHGPNGIVQAYSGDETYSFYVKNLSMPNNLINVYLDVG